MQEKHNTQIRYEKKHAFFSLLEDDSEDSLPDNPKYIAKTPSVLGKTNFIGFSSRFRDDTYTQQINYHNSSFEPRKSLVIKILPASLSPKNLESLKRQVLYIGKLLEVEVVKSANMDEELTKLNKQTQLYDHNFKILDKSEVENITKTWVKGIEDGEVVSRHILLSIGGKEDKNKALAVTKLFLEDVFRSKGYDYFFAAHYDTENDHFHVVVKKRNNLGQNLRFNKNDTFILRQKYADYLEKVGIKRQVLARRDQKQVLQKIDEKEEHLKNNNSWYQARLNKGNQKDYNAYNHKANIAGRIEEEINVLKIKSYLKNSLDVSDENILNKLRFNLRKNGLEVTLDSLVAVKQMKDKEMKILNLEGLIIQAVEKQFKSNKVKLLVKKEEILVRSKRIKTVYIPEFTANQIQEKFKAAILNHFTTPETRADLSKNLDIAIRQSFDNCSSKIRFGDKKSCEIMWYGDAGYVLDYRSGEIFKWGKNNIKHDESYSYKEVSQEELEKQKQEQKNNKEKLEAEKSEIRKLTSQKAQNLFNKYHEEKATAISYLRKKGIEDLNIKNIKYHQGRIVVPVTDVEEKIWSLQYINEDSSKTFLKNGQKKGNFFVLQNENKSTQLSDEKIIYLTEGLATAATINKATGSNVVVCFDAGNIEDVVVNLSKKFPDKKYIIMADNDLWKEKNTGRQKAEDVIKKHQNQINISMLLPQFAPEHKELRPTDFNDLQKLSGIGEITRQIEEGIKNNFSKERTITIKSNPVANQEEIMVDCLKQLKNKIIDCTDKQFIKKEVDDAIKYLQNIDNKYAKSINDKINNDEIKYSYTQPKQEVKYLGKIKAELNLENNNGLKIS